MGSCVLQKKREKTNFAHKMMKKLLLFEICVLIMLCSCAKKPLVSSAVQVDSATHTQTLGQYFSRKDSVYQITQDSNIIILFKPIRKEIYDRKEPILMPSPLFAVLFDSLTISPYTEKVSFG